jgi:hypothetical protein
MLTRRPYSRPGVAGEGYGDGNLSYDCTGCGTNVNPSLLRVTKFRNDALNLVKKDQTMPGTVLNLKTGIPEKLNPECDQLFPNRLVRKGLLAKVVDLVSPGIESRPTIENIRDMISEITSQHADSKGLKNVEEKKGVMAVAPTSLAREARMQARRMMSRYWDNFSIFALDLCSAVMRQGIFTEKMRKVCGDPCPHSRLLLPKNVSIARLAP